MKKETVKKAIAPTIVVTLIFFVNYFLFGMENTIIGPFLTLSFLKFQGMERYHGCMLRSFGIYSVMALAAYLALLHPVLNVVCNAAALFWIGYFLIDEYNPLNYFPAGMALIFFQISPAEGRYLFRRILALAVSFLLVFLFLEVSRHWRHDRQGQIEALAAQGMGACRELEDLLTKLGGLRRQLEKEDGQSEESLPPAQKAVREEEAALVDAAQKKRQELCRINRTLSLKIYERNRSALKKELAENVYCSYIACFQMISYLANVILFEPVGDGQVQLQELKNLLEQYQGFGGEGDPKGERMRLKFRENPLDIRAFRLRFALRQVFVMTPCLLFGLLCPWGNSYWLAISVFFMMIPIYENTIPRVAQRVWGSILGIGVCLVAFTLFQGFWPRVLLMTIANFFIYCSGSYTSTVMCITCSALALNLGGDPAAVLLARRLAYTLAGAVIAIFANLWVMRIRAGRQCQYVMELMDALRQSAAQAAELPQEQRHREMNRIMVKSYLLGSRMEEFCRITDTGQQEEVEEFISQHMLAISRQMLSKLLVL